MREYVIEGDVQVFIFRGARAYIGKKFGRKDKVADFTGQVVPDLFGFFIGALFVGLECDSLLLWCVLTLLIICSYTLMLVMLNLET